MEEFAKKLQELSQTEQKQSPGMDEKCIKAAPGPKPKSFGEIKVRVDFNVGGHSTVDNFKRKTADLINDLDALHNDEVSKTYNLSADALQHYSGEKLALIAKAVDAYELAAMYAVKAATA